MPARCKCGAVYEDLVAGDWFPLHGRGGRCDNSLMSVLLVHERSYRTWQANQVITTAGYSPEEQAAYCANYCVEGEHHMCCALRDDLRRRTWPKTVKDPRTGKRRDYTVTTLFRRTDHRRPRHGDWVGDDMPMAYIPQVHTRDTYDIWEKVEEHQQRDHEDRS